jgi:hypothetical protein
MVIGTLEGLALHSALATRPASLSLRSASPNPPTMRNCAGTRPTAARDRAGWRASECRLCVTAKPAQRGLRTR